MSRLSGQEGWRRYRTAITVPNPAAATDWSYSIGASTILHLFSISALYTADANVATRSTTLAVAIGGLTIVAPPVGPNVTAGGTMLYTWAAHIDTVASGVRAQQSIPDLWLEPGATISVSTASKQAGDQWSAITIYAELTTFKGGPINLLDVPAMTVVIANPAE